MTKPIRFIEAYQLKNLLKYEVDKVKVIDVRDSDFIVSKCVNASLLSTQLKLYNVIGR